ncbi:MAG: hypothetical protein HZB55_03860 [Deltaproteobacteria bacterium]|nr:hypothetical protein [Deltaproteobacteria bacterium]
MTEIEKAVITARLRDQAERVATDHSDELVALATAAQALIGVPGSSNAGPHLARASALRLLGHLDEALWHGVCAARDAPDNSACRREWAALQLALGEPHEAERAARRSVELDPANEASWRMLFLTLLARGKYVEAREAIRRATACAPQDPLVRALFQGVGTLARTARSGARSGRPAAPDRRMRHHYQLAHVGLRAWCQTHPTVFFSAMGSDDRDKLLDHIWAYLCTRCDPHWEADFDIRDVEVTTTLIADFPTVLFCLPPPKFWPEAHLTAAVWKVPLSNILAEVPTGEPAEAAEASVPDDPDAPPENSVAYFTLEKGYREDGTECTYVCSWGGTDERRNFGEGPPPDTGLFLDAVSHLLWEQ